MNHRLVFMGILSLLAVSCSFEETVRLKDDIDYPADEVFYVTIDEQPNAGTKVYADDDLHLQWNHDDRFSIFNKNTYNWEYSFTGSDGASSGKVKPVGEAGEGEALDLVYAVYPYSESTTIDASTLEVSSAAPEVQYYHENSFGIGANLMVSKTGDNRLRFKNAGGYLSLKFYGEGVSVSSVTLKGNNGELLSGPCTIATSGEYPVQTMSQGADDHVTIACNPSVDLGATASGAVQFIFVVPPTTFTKGFNITVVTSDGRVFKKSTSKKCKIERSAITRYEALEVVPVVRCSDMFLDVDYAGDGQVYHKLDVYLPSEVRASYPVVVHIYGSAWYSNNSKGTADLESICQSLLDAGYAVVTPNHRSSSDAKFPAQIHDIKAVVRFVRAMAEEYHFDTSFIGISGFSSGAHLASLAGTSSNVKQTTVGSVSVDLEGSVGPYTSYSSAVDCVCDWAGPIDMLNMGCEWTRPWGGTPEEDLLGVAYAGQDDLFRTISPITYLDPSDPPIIIFHGTSDNVVPHCQSVELYDAVQDQGIMTNLKLVEGAGHGINLFVQPWLSEMVAFVNAAR